MRLFLLFFLVNCYRLNAQDSSIVIRAGTTFHESVPVKEIYQYPQFVNGKVFLKSGDSAVARLNYHRFLDEMQFIGMKKDTLSIANPGLIKFIRIDSDTFYYDEGYVMLVRDTSGIKLASKQTLRVSDISKIGGYGATNPASAIDSYKTFIGERTIYNLVPMENITLKKRTEYYFGDKYNHFVLATRKNLLQQYSRVSRKLNDYLKENNVSFNDREQLEKLLQFLVGL